jgi:hypothetical protein
MPLIKQCEVCGTDFRTKPFFVKNGGGKYCSKTCHYEGIKRGRVVSCFTCGVEVYKTLKALKGSVSGKYFCGKSCQTKWRNTQFVGEKHVNWIHGRNAYRSVLTRNNVKEECTLCGVEDKRILAVHHKDRNRTNNTLKNLAWLCHNCHFLVHNFGAGKEKDLLK